MEFIDTDVKILKRKVKKKNKWGNWYHKSANNTLQNTRTRYYIDLDTLKTSRDLVDWIFQVANKTSTTRVEIADMIYALEYLLEPQNQKVTDNNVIRLVTQGVTND
jgi:hypothetical protein|tara:strand:+ start:403 stop:720 length:318 start_codon:yes stop_codon:yes gene_type:complete